MDNKLQELTQKLYDEGLSKGRQESDALIAESQSTANNIISQAKAEAARIVSDADAKAADLHKNSLTEIKLAGRQVIAELKESIADMIVSSSVSKGVASANLDPQFVKDILVAVATNWQGVSSDVVELRALLPADKEGKLGVAFESSVKSAISNGLDIEYSSGVKSGFKIEPKAGGFYISFSDADFDALLGEYLRPKVTEILYKESK